jgi:hypothetical protein
MNWIAHIRDMTGEQYPRLSGGWIARRRPGIFRLDKPRRLAYIITL